MPGNIQGLSSSDTAEWPPRNTTDPVRRTWMPIHAMVLLGASTILVSMRIWFRSRSLAGRFGLDDVLLLGAWLFSAGLSSVAVVQTTRYDLDRHTWDVDPAKYVGAAFTGWLAQIFFHIASCATKCSVLLFYRRTFREVGHHRRWLNASYAALGVTLGYSLGIFVAYFFICIPLESYWKSYDPSYSVDYRCLSGKAVSLCIGLGSVITDVIAVCLPYLVLRRHHLRVDHSRRVGLHLIFTLGLLVAAAGCVRTYYLWDLAHNTDTSWTGFDLFVWSLVECHFAVIIASIPSARAFFRTYLTTNHRRRTMIREDVILHIIPVAEASELVKGGEVEVQHRNSHETCLQRKAAWPVESSEPARDRECNCT